MTDKKIMIDGIDVSGCECYNPNIKMDCLLYPLQSDACKNNPNCHYKLYKRKEQECEELRKENKKLIWKCLERKCKIINLINENSTKEVIYRINGKCVKTTANRVKEITAIVNNQLKKYEQQDRYKQAIDEISELANENKNTPQYRGICQSILEIINNEKDINVPTKKENICQ